MTANPDTLLAILVMTLAALAAKGGGFFAMRWLGRHRFVVAWLEHAPGAVMVAAASVPIVQAGGAYWVAAAAIATRFLGGFTPGLFGAVAAVAIARWAGLS